MIDLKYMYIILYIIVISMIISMIYIILYIIVMSLTDNARWDCKICIAAGSSGRNGIWNAKRDGGNSFATDKQLMQSWVTHQGICGKRKSAVKNWMSSFSSSSSSIGLGQKRAFEFMDTCLDDTGFFNTERAKEYLTNKQQEELSSTEEPQQYDEYNADNGADFSSSSTSSSSSSSSFERREQQQEQEQEPDHDDNSDVPFCLRTSKKSLILEGDVNKASDCVYEHQQTLLEEYSARSLSGSIHTKASAGHDKHSKLTLKDYILLADWVESSNISYEAGDKLLKVLNNILEAHGLLQLLKFPAQIETIVKSINKRATECHPFFDFAIKMPAAQWGTTLPDGITPLPDIKCHRFCFLHLLAER